VAITHIDKILKGFKPNQGFTLKNYASAIFGGVIRDNLRQRGEIDLCTPWSMLRKLSQTRLVESLQAAGLTTETIACYVLAWNCFKTVYVPTKIAVTRRLPRPDSATWEAIASLYNTLRHQQPNPPKLVANPEIIEKWLFICVKAARDYLYPPITSINTPMTGQESGDWLDILPADESESLLTEIITQEEEQSRNEKKSQMHAVLVAAIQKLEPEAQKLLPLYYGQGLTQKQLEHQLEIKQYTISRRLSQARKSLLLALAQWSRDTLHISLSSDVLKDTNIFIEEWLQLYYSHPDGPPRRE
jgi:RNA polymerase sigma factor (sigma-70 family)